MVSEWWTLFSKKLHTGKILWGNNGGIQNSLTDFMWKKVKSISHNFSQRSWNATYTKVSFQLQNHCVIKITLALFDHCSLSNMLYPVHYAIACILWLEAPLDNCLFSKFILEKDECSGWWGCFGTGFSLISQFQSHGVQCNLHCSHFKIHSIKTGIIWIMYQCCGKSLALQHEWSPTPMMQFMLIPAGPNLSTARDIPCMTLPPKLFAIHM